MNGDKLFETLWSVYDEVSQDGVSKLDYAAHLTFLLFLKIDNEYASRRLNPVHVVAPGYDWPTLASASGADLEAQYHNVLTQLSHKPDLLNVVFARANHWVSGPAKLERLVKEAVGSISWLAQRPADRSDAWVKVLVQAAENFESKAGQYLTPLPLVRTIVECLRPAPGDTIIDPACGTASFLVAARQWIDAHHGSNLTPEQRELLTNGGISGEDVSERIGRLGVMHLLLAGLIRIDGPQLVKIRNALSTEPQRRVNVVLTNPPFRSIAEGVGNRNDLMTNTNNLQLNFVQHVASLLEVHGRAALLVPDNVLFEGGAGERIRTRLLREFDMHTLLRLPTGIFTAGGAKINVLFFDRKPPRPGGTAWTDKLWVYDMRTGYHFRARQRPVTQEDFADFLACFQPGESREARVPRERFRPYSYADLRERDKTGLDIFWLSDSSLAGADSALAPKVIAREIADEIRAALQEFDAIAEALPDNEEADGANPADEETA